MNITEQIYETVKTLPEQSVCEVLNFVEKLKAKQVENEQNRKAKALAMLAKYRGRFKAEKFDREDFQVREI